MFGEEGYLGAKRQKGSMALIFPVHPRELEAQKKREQIDSELEEIMKLRKEMESELEEIRKAKRGE